MLSRYDRIVFSLIALALAVIALNPWIAPGYVRAQSSTMDVNITGVSAHVSPLKVDITQVGEVAILMPDVKATPAIPVYVMNK